MPLWLPVFLGVGCGLYFALPFEPAWPIFFIGLAVAAPAALSRRARFLAFPAALLLGFGLAQLRERAVATPVLDHPMVAHLTGRLVALEPRGATQRAVLGDVRSGAFAPEVVPRRVRVALRGAQELRPGDWLSLTARLDAPPPPVEPGARDLGRELFFQSIGAVGFAYGKARVTLAGEPPPPLGALRARVESLRGAVTRRILAVLPGSTGGIAAALITGTRGGIAEEDEAALRDAGLAHVLAIAGLHMALVGGGLFFVVRALLAAVPAIALRFPIKKWAALAALLASAFYLVISGAAAPSVRAFVMLAMVMLAVLADRPALSMRALALAAAILLVARPESIVEPGFQMSFAAVAALIAVAEWEGSHPAPERARLWRYLHGIALTSLVGSLATWPFALFHFGRATHYAVLGNLIAMPVMGLWVMPAAALAVMLMPLGLDAPALRLMGWGIEVMVAMGRWVSGLPGAVSLAPAMPLAALVLVSLGGLWLAIWQRGARWLGLLPMLAGAVLALLAPRPDLLVAPDARTVAVRGDDGRLYFVRPPRDKFAARDWLRRDGDARDLGQAVGQAHCDGLGCVARRGGLVIAASQRLEALEEDCTRAQILVSAVDADCREAALLIDRRKALAGEGWAIWFSPGLTAQSVRTWRGNRPWVPRMPQE